MDELRRLFIDAGVDEIEVDSVLGRLGIQQLEHLAYFTSPDEYERAGVRSMMAQKILAQRAAEYKNTLDEDRRGQEDPEETGVISSTSTVLAPIPKDSDWLEGLRQQGILQFSTQTYMAGIKALLAANLGTFTAITRLKDLVSEYALTNGLAAPNLYYDLQNILARREFGPIFAALEENRVGNVPIYASIDDVNDLGIRMQNILVPEILEAVEALSAWHEELTKLKKTDFFVQQTMTSIQDMTADSYPNTAKLYDAGKQLRLKINQTFASNGIQKALAIQGEYESFMRILNNPELPASVGAVDRDNVMKMLGLDAKAAIVRAAPYIAQFVLNMVEVENLAKPSELRFFIDLHRLTMQIDWSTLQSNTPIKVNQIDQVATTSEPLVKQIQSTSTAIPAMDDGDRDDNADIDVGLRRLDGSGVNWQ